MTEAVLKMRLHILALPFAIMATSTARGTSAETVVQDPLAPALRGLAECTSPDEQGHLCHALTYYRRSADGKWSYTAEILLSQDQPVTLAVDTDVSLKGAAVCGFNRRADLISGTLRVNGQPLPPEKAAPFLSRIADKMQSGGILDVETCETTVQTTDGLVLRGTVGGKPAPIPDRRLLWVDINNGWKVGQVQSASPAPAKPGS